MSTELGKRNVKTSFTEKLEIPSGLHIQINGTTVHIQGKKGKVQRTFLMPQISMATEGNTLVFTTEGMSKKEKRTLFTTIAHIKNMFHGAGEGHLYRLKICSGHFPMNVSVASNEVVVKNFLGEKYPRKLRFEKDIQVKVDGDSIVVESADKEAAGRTAAGIEHLTNARGKDRRIFQDGIYVTIKDGKDIK